jgi:pyruvate kinase
MLQYQGDSRDTLVRLAEDRLVQHGLVDVGDLIVVTFGDPIGVQGGTNTMKIVRVGEQE